MKEILYGILLATFVFSAYASSKEITDNMLIGNWKCQKTISKITNYDETGNVINVEAKDLGKISFPNYKKDANGMMIIAYSGISYEPYLFKVKDEGLFTPLFHDGSNEQGLDVKFDHEYIFISNDEFELINNIFFRGTKSQKIERENYSKWLCKRVTE